MKQIIKNKIPTKLFDFLKMQKDIRELKKNNRLDYKRFINNAFLLKKEINKENLKAEISMHSHRIEKGLSYPVFKEGIGKNVSISLISALSKYKEKSYDLNDVVYQNGVSVINEYIIKHQNSTIDTSYLQDKLRYLSTNTINNFGGTIKLKYSDVEKFALSDFKEFIYNRHSVRDYSDKAVPISVINEALEIASHTPSACNKQPWKTYVVQNLDTIKKILKIKGGLSGEDNIKVLILITYDNNYLQNASEKNQGFIEGGMYGMNLLHALHYKKLAVCTINARSVIKVDKQIRNILNVTESENFIFFIAVGNYLDEYIVPKSKRDDYKSKTKYFN